MYFLSVFKRSFCMFAFLSISISAMEQGQNIGSNSELAKIELQTQLCDAIRKDNQELFKKTLDQGADINSKILGGFTPLMNAVLSDKENMVKLLLELGADVNQKNSSGTSALFFAVLSKSTKENINIIKMLLDANADVLGTNSNGSNILHLFCASNNNEAGKLIFKKLDQKYPLKIGELLSQSNNNGNTPLLQVIEFGNIEFGNSEIVPMLLQHGLDVHNKNYLFAAMKKMISAVVYQDEKSNLQKQEQIIHNYFKIIQLLSKNLKNVGVVTKDTKPTEFEDALQYLCYYMINFAKDGIYNKTVADTFALLREHGALFLSEFNITKDEYDKYKQYDLEKENPETFYSALSTAYAKHRTNGKNTIFSLLKNRELTRKQK